MKTTFAFEQVTDPLPATLADEVALLLTTEGIESERHRGAGGTIVAVSPNDRRRTLTILAEEYPEGLAAVAARPPANTTADEPMPRWFGRASWVLFVLAAACTAIFVAAELSGGSESRAVLLRFGATRPAHVRTGEWWRLVTALFVHIGPRHLLANVATLLVLGPALARALGAGRLLLIWVLAGTAGNAFSYQVTHPDVVSAGASGAILGILGALGGTRIRFAASARFRGWQVVAAILAYLAIAVGAAPTVDTAAHLGGLVAGFALGLVVPPLGEPPTPRDRALSLACGTTAAVVLALAYGGLLTAR